MNFGPNTGSPRDDGLRNLAGTVVSSVRIIIVIITWYVKEGSNNYYYEIE